MRNDRVTVSLDDDAWAELKELTGLLDREFRGGYRRI